MNKQFILICGGLIIILMSACNLIAGPFSVTQGSGNVISQDRNVSNFSQVSLGGFGELILTQGTSEGLKIEAEDNILPQLTSEVRNNTLYIDFKNQNWRNSIHPTKPIKFYVTYKNLNGVSISGAATISADQITTDTFSLNSSGASKINIGTLNAKSLDLNFSGGADCQISGSVTSQNIVVSGMAHYNAAKLASDQASIHISGSGDTTIWAKNNLDITISGAGIVNYYGQPKLIQNISGAGKINSLGTP
jgi:hypothetical protein